MPWIRNISNVLTSLNLLCGFSSIFFSFEGKILYAFYFVALGLIFDMLDGRIARTLKISSKFGIEFDSMADLVTFGVAPSMILYNGFLKNVELGKLVAFVQTLAVAIRLARFNVSSSERPKEYFEGLSSPMGAFFLASFVLLIDTYGVSFAYLDVVFIVLTFLIALLEISTIRFRSFKELKLPPYLLFLPPVMFWLLIFKQKLFLLLVFTLVSAYIIYNIIFENYGKGVHIRHYVKRRRASTRLFDDSRREDKDGIGSGEARGGHN